MLASLACGQVQPQLHVLKAALCGSILPIKAASWLDVARFIIVHPLFLRF
jgi:hypothetical protein